MRRGQEKEDMVVGSDLVAAGCGLRASGFGLRAAGGLESSHGILFKIQKN